MNIKKIGSERLTFPNDSKQNTENKMTKSSLSINNRPKNKKNMSQQNSAKRDGCSNKKSEIKNNRKNLSR